MKKRVVSVALVLFLVLSLTGTGVPAQKMCVTVDQALGFATEKALDTFLSLAKRAAKNPSIGPELKKQLQTFVAENEAFALKGGDKVTVLEDKGGADPSMGKVKVQSAKDKRVFWVPSGALNCK
jgi:hypothetical protein